MRMAQWALQFTPDVCLGQWPDVILLEVAPSLRLWGGCGRLLQALETGATRLGWPSLQLAQAPTPRLAEWHVCAPGRPLQDLPLSVVPEAMAHQERFSQMGLSTLGALLSLPRAGLRRRFGKVFVEALEAALGERPDPRLPIEPPATFEEGLEFALPTDAKPILESACQRLLEAGLAWLAAKHSGVEVLCFRCHQGRRRHQDLLIRLSQASRDRDRIERLLSEQLGQTSLSAPVSGVALLLEHPVPLTDQTTDLFPETHPAEAEEGLQTLCERPSARLGERQVSRLVVCNSHRPESASSLEDWSARPAAAARASASAPPGSSLPMAALPPRPVWLLDTPLALRLWKDRPLYEGPLRLRAGPERIEAEWWSSPIARDYFVAETQDHRLVWVFRTPTHEWFLHGLFG